jgi:hypothetical protein
MKTLIIKVQVPDDYSEEQILVCGHEGEIMGIFKSEIIPRPTDDEMVAILDNAKSAYAWRGRVIRGADIMRNYYHGEDGE